MWCNGRFILSCGSQTNSRTEWGILIFDGYKTYIGSAIGIGTGSTVVFSFYKWFVPPSVYNLYVCSSRQCWVQCTMCVQCWSVIVLSWRRTMTNMTSNLKRGSRQWRFWFGLGAMFIRRQIREPMFFAACAPNRDSGFIKFAHYICKNEWNRNVELMNLHFVSMSISLSFFAMF